MNGGEKSVQENKRISDAEWVVMEELWSEAPLTAAQVVGNLRSYHNWKDQTIRTMLLRLTKKGCARMYQDGQSYLYEPMVRREDMVDRESSSFVNRVFGGSCKPLVLHFVEQGRLSEEEVHDLKKALEGFSSGK